MEAHLNLNNSESSFVSKGREAIPVDIALNTQKKLIEYMTPSELLPHLTTNNEYDPVLEALTMRWMEKYALNFNGFTEFCNINAENESLIYRILNNQLTNEDLASMRIFLEDSPTGGPLFTPDELNNFIMQNTH